VTELLHAPRLTVPVSERDHLKGTPTASVTLVEYGDFQCPYCGAAHPIVKEVQRLMGDDLLFAFRHFPLTQVHRHAGIAAEAAEAAGAQGSFWEMQDVLFEHQDHLSPPDLLGHAEAVGLDVDRFTAELESHAHEPRVREDFMSGIRSGVNGTPTFFINNIRHNGGYDLPSLLEAVRSAAP
jgi:protein-disulfide isomerase